MRQFEELSPEQRDPLFKLIEFQKKSRKDITFHRNGPAVFIPGSNEVLVTVDSSLIGAYAERKYISYHEPKRSSSDHTSPYFMALPELRLMPLALDYYDWIQKRGWQRWLIEQKDTWSSEWKAAIVSLIVAILTILIVSWLGY